MYLTPSPVTHVQVHNKQLIVTVGGIRQFNRVSVGQLYFMMRTKAEVLTVPSPGTADVAAAEAGIHVSRPTAQSSTTEAEIEHVVTEELGNRPDDFVHATTVQNELAQTHMATTPGVTALKGNENNTEVLATTLESQSTTITTPSTVPTTTASTTKIATIPVPLTTVSTTETSTVPILPTTVSETSLQGRCLVLCLGRLACFLPLAAYRMIAGLSSHSDNLLIALSVKFTRFYFV